MQAASDAIYPGSHLNTLCPGNSPLHWRRNHCHFLLHPSIFLFAWSSPSLRKAQHRYTSVWLSKQSCLLFMLWEFLPAWIQCWRSCLSSHCNKRSAHCQFAKINLCPNKAAWNSSSLLWGRARLGAGVVHWMHLITWRNNLFVISGVGCYVGFRSYFSSAEIQLVISMQ